MVSIPDSSSLSNSAAEPTTAPAMATLSDGISATQSEPDLAQRDDENVGAENAGENSDTTAVLESPTGELSIDPATQHGKRTKCTKALPALLVARSPSLISVSRAMTPPPMDSSGSSRFFASSSQAVENRSVAVVVSVVEFHVREGPSIRETFPDTLDIFDSEPQTTGAIATGVSRSNSGNRVRSKSDADGVAFSSQATRAKSPSVVQQSVSFETSLQSQLENPSGSISPSSRRRAVTLKLEQNYRTKLPFLALPDRADAQDHGFSYFLLRQAPSLVMGVSCFRQVESDEAVRGKHQRALVVMCNLPLFDFIRSLMEVHVNDILWATDANERLARMRALHVKLSSLIQPSLCREPKNIQGSTSLVQSLRVLGGAKTALILLKCLLLGNTGVMVTGPAGALVSQIVLSISGLLPRRGGMLGALIGENMGHSTTCRELAELAMAVLPPRLQGYAARKQNRYKSKLLLMPYCSLMEMDDIREVYTPRVTSKSGKGSELQGRCGYFAGTTNPVMASGVRNGLGDLILELDDSVLAAFLVGQGGAAAAGSTSATSASRKSASPSPVSGNSPTSASSTHAAFQQLERFSSRAAKFMREKTDEVVTKLQQLGNNSVRTATLTPAGRVAADLGGKDRAYVRKIDRLLLGSGREKFASMNKRRSRSKSPHKKKPSASGSASLKSSGAPRHTSSMSLTISTSDSSPPSCKPSPAPSVSAAPSLTSSWKKSGAAASFSSFMSSIAQLVDPDSHNTNNNNNSSENAARGETNETDHLAYEALDGGSSEGHSSVVDEEDAAVESLVGDVETDFGEGPRTEEELEAKIQELFVSWMNSLFSEISHFIDHGSLPQAPPGTIQGLVPSHNQDYLREWARRTQTTREKNTCSEVVQFANGDEYRGEILVSDADGFVDLDHDASRNLSHGVRVDRQGRGVYTAAQSGWRYEGAWENDVRQGNGVATCGDSFLFDGAWDGNRRNGRGTCIVKGKGQVSGVWDADVLRQGVFFDQNGNKLDAVFDDEGRVEEGVFMNAEGNASYKGRFNKAGLPHGVGNAAYPDESKYSGTFVNGQRHGQGAWSVSPLEWYAGGWKENVFNGDGILAFKLKSKAGDGEDGVSKPVELEATWNAGKLDPVRLCCVRDAVTREPIFEGKLQDWDSATQVPSFSPPTMSFKPEYMPHDFACFLEPLPSCEGKVLPSLPSDSEYDTESE